MTAAGSAGPVAAARPARPVRRRRVARHLGTTLMVLGVAVIAYAAAVLFWRDPVTDLYARYRQHQLAAPLERSEARWRADLAPRFRAAPPSADPRLVRQAAARFLAELGPGDPVGRLRVPRLGIGPVFVNGTRWAEDLSRGPGRYPQTSVPGLGRVTAIAGHRTTFGAWFRHIDSLEAGDRVVLQLPYGTFVYRVSGHRIVDNGDWSIIRPRGYDELVLSACHPLYSASHRWVVFARLAEVKTPGGRTYRPRA